MGLQTRAACSRGIKCLPCMQSIERFYCLIIPFTCKNDHHQSQSVLESVDPWTRDWTEVDWITEEEGLLHFIHSLLLFFCTKEGGGGGGETRRTLPRVEQMNWLHALSWYGRLPMRIDYFSMKSFISFQNLPQIDRSCSIHWLLVNSIR